MNQLLSFSISSTLVIERCQKKNAPLIILKMSSRPPPSLLILMSNQHNI